jgi:hypothetical protein
MLDGSATEGTNPAGAKATSIGSENPLANVETAPLGVTSPIPPPETLATNGSRLESNASP